MDNVPFVQISVAIVTFVLAFIFRKALISRFMVDGEMSKMNNILTTILLMGVPFIVSDLLVSNFFPASRTNSLLSMLIFLLSTELYFYVLTKIERVKPSGFVALFTK